MSELGEAFEGWRAMKQAKRASNREQSAALLRRAGVIFDTKNDGAHLVVTAGPLTVDFWPGTGLWIVRGLKIQRRRRGVRKLIDFVEAARAGKQESKG